jgi:glucose-6-phosphate 1-dehydrogenase
MMTMVIFGGTGDLAKNKLFKALFHLEHQGLIKGDTRIVGFSRKEMSDVNYRELVRGYIGGDVSDDFLQKISYFQGDLKDVESYKALEKHLKQKDDERGICSSKLFYLAVSPSLYEDSFNNLAKSGLSEICSGTDKWTRILVEKPFGSDIESAKRLDEQLGKLFQENQVYRIDHYLAKEAVQNFITFRFANSIFEPLWNREHIDNVKIELLETDGVDGRGAFYDGIGALRDVGQNHILQMLSLISMENPKSVDPEMIRTKRAEALRKVKLFPGDLKENVLRGQYKGYVDVEGVANDSQTETFFRLKLGINNKRWKGVPFYIESGKGLNDQLARITINFKQVVSCVCPRSAPTGASRGTPKDLNIPHRNKIVFEIQPENKIMVRFWAKKPSLHYELINEDLSFDYSSRDERKGDAYEKVLHDAIEGDLTLFTSSKEVEAQWKTVYDIRSKWEELSLVKYEKGAKVESISYQK